MRSPINWLKYQLCNYKDIIYYKTEFKFIEIKSN